MDQSSLELSSASFYYHSSFDFNIAAFRLCLTVTKQMKKVAAFPDLIKCLCNQMVAELSGAHLHTSHWFLFFKGYFFIFIYEEGDMKQMSPTGLEPENIMICRINLFSAKI